MLLRKPTIDTLDGALAALARDLGGKIYCGARAIVPGDEWELTEAELARFRTAAPSVRRSSATARIVARQLFKAASAPPPSDICKASSGAPIWPENFVGSLSHDEHVAVAAIAERRHFKSIGIDVEPATPLAPELLPLVATRYEIEQISDLSHSPKLLFCIKEAVYKATNVLDGLYLEHHDVEFSFETGVASVRNGRRVKVRTVARPRLVALAVIS